MIDRREPEASLLLQSLSFEASLELEQPSDAKVAFDDRYAVLGQVSSTQFDSESEADAALKVSVLCHRPLSVIRFHLAAFSDRLTRYSFC